jgi:hypothetical protein
MAKIGSKWSARAEAFCRPWKARSTPRRLSCEVGRLGRPRSRNQSAGPGGRPKKEVSMSSKAANQILKREHVSSSLAATTPDNCSGTNGPCSDRRLDPCKRRGLDRTEQIVPSPDCLLAIGTLQTPCDHDSRDMRAIAKLSLDEQVCLPDGVAKGRFPQPPQSLGR